MINEFLFSYIFRKISDDYFYGEPDFLKAFIKYLDKKFPNITSQKEYKKRAYEEIMFLIRTHEE
jgi:hypothetical protein